MTEPPKPKPAPAPAPKPAPKLGAQPLPAAKYVVPPKMAPVLVKSGKTPAEKLAAVMAKEMTWAEAMGMTQAEAFGIAQSAYRLFEHGQREKGRGVMEGLVVANPKVGSFHALLGAMAGRMGDDVEAERRYTIAIELEPANLSARVNRAELLLKTGHLDRALDDLLAATKIDPQQKTPLGKRAWRLARVTSSALRELIGRGTKKPAVKPPAPRR
ncbi:MAG: hypothetical protein Q8O67_26170 [Deltaproteobacteria bacterium]|nr:hypothetical protein [Deltaproteobacteria bacterium]